MFRRRGIAAFLALAALLAAGPGALAQQQGASPPPADSPGRSVPPIVVDTPPPNGDAVLPVLTLDQDTLYLRSQWGQRVQDELEQRGREIAAENDRLADQFSAEEQQLTALRQTLPPDEFRQRADEFDKRVVEVRRARDAAARELQAEADEERQAFFRAALPVLAALMRERGAVVVLDQRAIFVAAQAIDVTELLIERMDREVGPGPLDEPAESEAPDPATPGEAPAESPAEAPAEAPGEGGPQPEAPDTPEAAEQ
ncbi:OmpH family outer membrane protein [Paracoccus sp. PS-1]|uniref:OmpH family outer membrane protein n=1 Tax=unclassified Paracoccus (in: a-proteobacteria) TaxID=2688777 RepID=UPI0004AF796C|nr:MULTISPECIES: OmpH family outer membrane protein [unclassified Paracoccus (in: a-proteobacteria)]MDQ7262787.1 OmpH family outer membrane protein [Paracoccus sp. PS1]